MADLQKFNNLPVYIDLTITIERLKNLFAPTIIWDRDWVDSIGRNLCLPEFKIRQIQRNYCNPVERKEAYLDLYAYDHPCPAWKDIAEILRLFNLSKQYDLVNETYIKGMTYCMIAYLHNKSISINWYYSFSTNFLIGNHSCII